MHRVTGLDEAAPSSEPAADREPGPTRADAIAAGQLAWQRWRAAPAPMAEPDRLHPGVHSHGGDAPQCGNWLGVLVIPSCVSLSGVTARFAEARDWAAGLAVALPQRLFDRNVVSRLDAVRALPGVWPLLAPYRVVARRADVADALTRPDVFVTSYPADLVGDFISRAAGEQHEQLSAALARALSDTAAAAALAAETAEKRVAEASEAGGLDVGADLVHPVLDRVVNDYVGLTGVAPDVLLASARDLFAGIFLNGYGLGPVHAAALIAKQRLGGHVDTLLQTAAPVGTVRAALQEEPAFRNFSPDAVRDNLIGLAIGWLFHGSRAAIIAVDELLERPEALAQARRAARAGDLAEVRRVLWEVLRFRPVQVGLIRQCASGTRFPDGTPIAAGAKVLLATHSAMWDGAAVPDPHAFDSTRAAAQYLIFGAGPHRCPGEALVRAQLPAMLAPLLRQDWLARAEGRAGRLRWIGESADGFRVVLPAPAAG